ncbi:MAG: hypothetical protein SF097_21235 [Acidobacteriota bacterium]|nr:hypothetical protein [Acidobacteriota bacterium]
MNQQANDTIDFSANETTAEGTETIAIDDLAVSADQENDIQGGVKVGKLLGVGY